MLEVKASFFTMTFHHIFFVMHLETSISYILCDVCVRTHVYTYHDS